uniref:ORF36 n=1 Tax=Nitrosopumilaceae spindle-shaped virus TaxID=3065433 RepID=A0AAT9JGE1_9VIRU
MNEDELWKEYLKKAEKAKKEYDKTIDKLRQEHDKKLRELQTLQIKEKLTRK